MRVIGGQWRGRVLVAPRGRATRPTSDRVREAMFGTLGSLPEARAAVPSEPSRDAPLAGHRVLDLFAGSGALGLEALSRGAATCTFVEKSRSALRSLTANLERLGVELADNDDREPRPTQAHQPPARVVGADMQAALRADAAKGSRYTLLFVDPPYSRYAEVEGTLADSLAPVLAPGAVIVVETDARSQPVLPWRTVREKRYGDTRVTILVASDLEEAGGNADHGPAHR